MPLSLTRKEGEAIKIGNDILVTVGQLRRGRVRILIQAPPEVQILRAEIAEIPEVRKPQPDYVPRRTRSKPPNKE